MSLNKMNTTVRALLGVSALSLIAACGEPVGSSMIRPTFGEAATSNIAAQSAYAQRGGAVTNLGAQFANQVPTTINFAFNRAELDSSARAILDQQAAWLQGKPGVTLRITGHTDRVGGEEYNQRLGMRRANAAVSYLVARGISPSRLAAVESLGEAQPVVDTEGRERRNRRAVTSVGGFSGRFAGGEFDGKRAVEIYKAYVSDTGEQLAAGESESITEQ